MYDLLIMCAFSAATFVVGKISIAYGAPFCITGVQMLIGGMLLMAYVYYKNGRLPVIEREHCWLVLQIGIFYIALSYGGDLWALQYVSAAKGSMIYASSPFVTALISLALFGEWLTRKKTIGLCIGIIGYLPLLVQDTPTEQALSAVGFLSLPELVFFVTVVFTAYGYVLISQLVKRYRYDPQVITGVSMLVGGALALFISFVTEGSFESTIYDFWPFVYWVGLLILVSNVVGMNLYSVMLKRYSATFISFVGFIAPVFTVAFEWFAYEAVPSFGFCATMAIVFVGIYLFYQEELRLNHIAG